MKREGKKQGNKRPCFLKIKITALTSSDFDGGVCGLGTKPVQCVEGFSGGLTGSDFEASESGSNFQNETNETVLKDLRLSHYSDIDNS
jgi:hypothetical protein